MKRNDKAACTSSTPDTPVTAFEAVSMSTLLLDADIWRNFERIDVWYMVRLLYMNQIYKAPILVKLHLQSSRSTASFWKSPIDSIEYDFIRIWKSETGKAWQISRDG